MKPSFFIAIFLFTLFLGQSFSEAKDRVTAKQVLEFSFLAQKPKVVSTLRDKLKKNKPSFLLHGSFFKGDVSQLKNAVKRLPLKELQVKSFYRGFEVFLGEGKERVGVEVEFLDPLSGKIRISGKELLLKKDMSYLEFVRTLSPAAFSPLDQELKEKKKTSFNPWNFLIPEALGKDREWENREDREDRDFSEFVQPTLYWLAPAIEMSRIQSQVNHTRGKFHYLKRYSVYVAAFFVAAYGIDFFYTVFKDIFTDQAETKIASILNSLDEVLKFCERSYGLFYAKGDDDTYSIDQEKIDQLSSQHLNEFSDFKKMWLFNHNQNQKNIDNQVRCEELTKERGLKYLEKANMPIVRSMNRVFSIPNYRSMTFRRKIRPICAKYQEVNDCFSSASSPYGENNFAKGTTAISDTAKGSRKESTEETMMGIEIFKEYIIQDSSGVVR